jgi:hypothetical protein
MERARGVLITIARLAGCTPAAVGDRPKWTNRRKHGGDQEEISICF